MRLFDTTFLVDVVNKDDGAGELAEKIDREQSFAAMSVITVYEYLRGVYYAYHSTKQFGERLESANRDLAAFQIVPLTVEIARESARLQAMLQQKGRILGVNDLYVAATALSLKLTLVTRNIQDFERVPDLSIETY